METSITEKIPDKSRHHGMVLDQAFKSPVSLHKSKTAGSKIVSKFGSKFGTKFPSSEFFKKSCL